MADAVGYLVDYLYPIKREIESKKNQRWVFGKGIN
jgi:hypothetical protein